MLIGLGFAMIIWQRVNDLRNEVGAEGFDELIDLFLEEVGEVIDRLRTDADPSKLEQDLHFLKGSALNLGFGTFCDLCQQGERLAATSAAEQVDIGALVDAFDQSQAEFLAGLTRNAAA